MILLVGTFQITVASAKTWDYQTSENVNKIWKVKFNMQLSEKSLTSSSIYVTDGSKTHPTTLSLAKDGYAVDIKPTTPYVVGKQYQIIVKTTVQANGKMLKTPIEVPFRIVDSTVKIQHAQNDISSIFTTVKVKTSSDVYRVTVDGEEMNYKGNNSFVYTLIDKSAGSSVYIYAYDENDRRIESLKYTITP